MKVLEFSPIVPLLREELASYGAILGAFDRQQDHLLHRRIDQVTVESEAIQTFVTEAAGLREKRETWVRHFATRHGQPEDATLKQLLPFFPVEQSPLIEALIKEINHLIHRVRRRVRQNHGLLARAVELHQDLRRQLLAPDTVPTVTYAPTGRVRDLTGPAGLRATG